jgi:hypothetical protein
MEGKAFNDSLEGAKVALKHASSPALIAAAEAAASKGMAGYQEFWKTASKIDRNLLTGEHERLKAQASDVDKTRTVEQPEPKAAPIAQAGNPAAPVANYEDLKAKIENAQTLDALMVSADWIGEIADPAQREELTQRYLALAAKFGS